MSIARVSAITASLLFMSMALVSCAGKQPKALGLTGMTLAPCPTTPNCVSSDSTDTEHQLLPFVLDESPELVWAAAREYIASQPRSRIISETPDYIHAEFKSLVFGFVDDLEIHLRVSDGVIAIRSASRSGYSDFGVNRERIEKLRTALSEQGLVH